MNSGIYKITIGDKFYIGSSVNIHKRIINHKSNLRKNKHHCRGLQNCYNKYLSFSFEVLEYCEISELQAKEQFYLDANVKDRLCVNSFKQAYSVTGENHPMFGKSHTNEAIIKIKEARSKQIIKHSLETKSKIGIGWRGKKQNPEIIKKMVAARNGIAWNKGLKSEFKRFRIFVSGCTSLDIVNRYLSGQKIDKIRSELNLDWERTKIILINSNVKIKTNNERSIRKLHS